MSTYIGGIRRKGNEMNFRHFETLREAKAYIKEADPHGDKLVCRKKHGKHAKPYAVATRLTHLHFTPDSWVSKAVKRRVKRAFG